MAIDIDQRITDNWPRTDAALVADSTIDYATAKTNAVSRAKREAYGTSTVPSEADIPDLVGEWIADKSTIRLIPVAKEFYAHSRYRTKSNPQGENVGYYDFLRMLDDLQSELDADCAANWPLVENLIGSSSLPNETPAVSVEGMMLDPVTRAQLRGVPS